MTLQEFILAAILTAVPQNAQKFGALQDKPRITAFSHTIAQAIEADSKNVKFTGDARHYVLATIVVATIWRESSFRKSVQFCKRKGDGGKSITSFQMMNYLVVLNILNVLDNIMVNSKSIPIIHGKKYILNNKFVMILILQRHNFCICGLISSSSQIAVFLQTGLQFMELVNLAEL